MKTEDEEEEVKVKEERGRVGQEGRRRRRAKDGAIEGCW